MLVENKLFARVFFVSSGVRQTNGTLSGINVKCDATVRFPHPSICGDRGFPKRLWGTRSRPLASKMSVCSEQNGRASDRTLEHP